jgi:ribonuclease BN (tRNA processing enzyme)
VKLTVIGCSPSWPNPGSAHSGYLIEHGEGRLLVDCGPGVLSRLRAAEGWPRIDAIAITHFHLDHCGDLVPWLWGHLMGSASGLPAPALWLPPAGRADLERLATRFDQVFPVSEYTDGEPFEAAGLTVTPRAVRHYSQPTYGLRIEGGGRVVAFSADSGPTPALGELAKGVDLFVCEATLEETEDEPRGHLTAREAAAAALAARAKRLLLVHRPAEISTPDGLEVARDGLAITV